MSRNRITPQLYLGRLRSSGTLSGRRVAATAFFFLLTALGYYASARLGLRLELVGGQVTPLWPPTGVALVCLLRFGVRMWPAVTIGALVVNLPLGPTPLAACLIAAGNTLAPVCAVLLLRHVGYRPEMTRLRDALALVFLGALAGMAVSATVGAAALVTAGGVSPGAFWSTWSVWWVGDAMGVLVVAPVLLVLPALRSLGRVGPWRWVEWTGALTGTVLSLLLAVHTPVAALFPVFPFLIWAALRFPQVGSAPCALAASVIAVHAAVTQAGPFGDHDLLFNMVVLQIFNASAALTALLLSAITAERDQAHREVRRACAQLTAVVATLRSQQ
ncbi:MASE1 domain-containing protein [Phytomonospora endophytica]|uniref:Integral membrane sensor domain MASE1 n=1 Tax=Phytomonospora endophytica TaxID=714109 RepID=A0A841FKG8_9ACTN|nr:MASE1 domain-containing protein [Phytomonospora endophytica]MBB6036375.1 integral membrane sensor domain MASE1 [Phytomonospora endophytica]GIG65696.1 membrane protein [Phytomonospora endophytica]